MKKPTLHQVLTQIERRAKRATLRAAKQARKDLYKAHRLKIDPKLWAEVIAASTRETDSRMIAAAYLFALARRAMIDVVGHPAILPETRASLMRKMSNIQDRIAQADPVALPMHEAPELPPAAEPAKILPEPAPHVAEPGSLF
ncbi:MAG TPA: hypothetical protein VM529_24880 [Gemmata sp.]|jgi:hypothetical protein|nr:hypothetical protein [Gemmata sp.]